MPRKRDPVMRQRRTALAVLAASIVFLVALNLVSWLFLFKLRDLIDVQFGKQLVLTAANAELSLDRTQVRALLADHDRLSLLFVQQQLTALKADHNLERALVIDANGTIAASSDPQLVAQAVTSYIFIQPGLLSAAWQGSSLASPLYKVEGLYFKSAFHPLRDQYESIIGLVAVEANAAFLETIRRFQRGLVIGGVASGLIIAFFFIFLLGTASQFMRIQESLGRSERLALLGGMASRITHEIRNPLGIIKSTADLLRRRYDNPERPDELFGYINGEVRRLNELIHNFLAFAREKGLEKKSVDLATLLADTAHSLQAECAEKGIDLTTSLGDSPYPALVDPDAIKQVVLNLVLNARDAIGQNGTISLQLDVRDRRQAVIRVRDTGTGIPAEQQEKIFDPFFSTKSSGSGLGLSISRKIVENHGGTIQVESRPDEGSTFSIFLPRE